MEALLGEHIDLAQVRKIGEGTFGEAFRGGDIVFKIVPLDGATLVNGEVQKRADEILAEVAISLTLSQLRGRPGEPHNATISESLKWPFPSKLSRATLPCGSLTCNATASLCLAASTARQQSYWTLLQWALSWLMNKQGHGECQGRWLPTRPPALWRRTGWASAAATTHLRC